MSDFILLDEMPLAIKKWQKEAEERQKAEMEQLVKNSRIYLLTGRTRKQKPSSGGR